MKNFDISELLKKSSSISVPQQFKYVWLLSIPGMIAQVSSILMQYIDAAMVGALGANASAAIGLVAPSTWVLGSLTHGMCVGFTVQTAHVVGAGEKDKAKSILFQSIIVSLVFSVFLALAGSCIAFKLPCWLGGSEEIAEDAAMYFLIFALSTPLYGLIYLMSGMLQCSGNMKLPGILNGALCLLDIFFNWIFIQVLNMGVTGAAAGSAASAVTVAVIITFYTLYKSEYLNLRGFKNKKLDWKCIKKAVKLAVPVCLESSAFSGALVIVSGIIAPLGAVSLAANSFATTAESLCYMPGYGVQEAAVTLVGQSYGANRQDLTKSFSWITILIGSLIMAFMGVIMYFICPFVFSFLTPDEQIRTLSVKVLRIELFAEPLFGASIVATGILRGKGDTLVSSILNLFSLYVVRISLSLWLVKLNGLEGIWIAMAVELCFRGLILMARIGFTSRRKKN